MPVMCVGASAMSCCDGARNTTTGGCGLGSRGTGVRGTRWSASAGIEPGGVCCGERGGGGVPLTVSGSALRSPAGAGADDGAGGDVGDRGDCARSGDDGIRLPPGGESARSGMLMPPGGESLAVALGSGVSTRTLLTLSGTGVLRLIPVG